MSSVPLSSSLKRSLAAATQEYSSQLAAGDAALAYLERRGLGSSPVTETLRFGVVRSPRPEHGRYTGRLAIPYLGPKGNVYGMTFRCIEPHDCKEIGCPKYLALDGERRMYNTAALMAPTEYLMVAEGELDTATLVACGWPAVGIPGANAWRPHYSRMMAGFRKVILWADGDEAGEKLAHTFRRAMPSSGDVMLCESGEDVNSTFRRIGKEGLTALLKKEGE